jgi:hypothetical protein
MDKESTELSGIESYVVDKIENEDISWFPTFKFFNPFLNNL